MRTKDIVMRTKGKKSVSVTFVTRKAIATLIKDPVYGEIEDKFKNDTTFMFYIDRGSALNLRVWAITHSLSVDSNISFTV
jgi:hypothetical protein